MANELTPNKEIGKSVAQVMNSGADIQTIADTLQKAYAKVELPKAEIVAEKPTVSEALAAARARKKVAKEDYGITAIKPKETAKKAIEKGSKKAEKAAKKAEKKAAEKAAKKAKEAKKEKKGLNKIAKEEKNAIDKSSKNDKDLAKLKKDKKKEKGKDDKEPKTASEKDKQMLEKIEKLKMSGLDIKEQGASWMMKVQDANGKDVLVDVTSAVEKLRGINDKIDQANGIIENTNKANAKPDVSLSPQSASIDGKAVKAADGKDATSSSAPTPTAPTVTAEAPVIAPQAIDAVKKETFSADLANFKSPEGVTLSEKDIKFLTDTALERFKDEKILKKLKEKEKEEKKNEHGAKSDSLATPTPVVGKVIAGR